MLTTKGRYAVMAMVDMVLENSNLPITLEKIALRQNIPLSYLEQIFNKLRKKQLVYSVKGPGGGYKLNKLAEEISIAEIVISVDEPVKMTRCNLEQSEGCRPDKARCATHDLWEGLSQQIMAYLSSISLADIENRSAVIGLHNSRETIPALGQTL
jgi:Rrf2 family iron-sulfur cluster assembly transcriptional regulator